MNAAGPLQVRVSAVDSVAEGIKRFCLEPVSQRLPPFSPGSHVIVTMTNGERTFRNPYSLMGSLSDCSQYQITVLHTQNSRGGSQFMHERAGIGTILSISRPMNLFPLDLRAKKHLLIAGGIGVTPLIPMAAELKRRGSDFELHYCVRGESRAAYAKDLVERHGSHVRVYRDDVGEALPTQTLLENQPLSTHLYVCGPAGMIEHVVNTAHAAGWPAQNVHVERFTAPACGQPFDVKLARWGQTVRVEEHQSILEALETAGFNPPYQCRGGACGQCRVGVLAAEGELVHHDHVLTPEQHAAGRDIMICVSRLRGRELVIDL